MLVISQLKHLQGCFAKILHMGDTSAHNSASVELEEDEYWPLSGKPYFDVVLSKTHVKPKYQMYLPIKLLPDLPPGPCTKPVVLTYRGKSWNMLYNRGSKHHSFHTGWKKFVIDNDLKVEDACVFELSECGASEIKFIVQILRGDFPSELLGKVDGETPETAIIID